VFIGGQGLRQHLFHHLAVHVGQPEMAAILGQAAR
jgi:hypothetical protein